MNPYRHFIGEIEAALRSLQAAGELPEKLDFSAIVAKPCDAANGEIATNVLPRSLSRIRRSRKTSRSPSENMIRTE